MTIEPTRRSFLIGMGSLAALAAVEIPAQAKLLVPRSLGTSSIMVSGDRAIYDLIISGFANPGGDITPRHLSFRRLRDPAPDYGL